MKRASTAEEKAQRDKALRSKTKSKSPSSGGAGLYVRVKTHTRRLKSGKVVTVKEHTTKRLSAATVKAARTAGRNVTTGKDSKRLKLRAEKFLDQDFNLSVSFLKTLTEGTLKYEKGETSFDTLVNAVSSLCTSEKGKYKFTGKSPIERLFRLSRGYVPLDHLKLVCSGVRKKLGASIKKAPEGVREELSRYNTRAKYDRAKEAEKMTDMGIKIARANRSYVRDHLKELRSNSPGRHIRRVGFLTKD